MTATTFATVVTHTRRDPVRHRFVYRTRPWLVDLDQLPRLPRGLRWLADFRAADHLGDPTVSVRQNVGAFLSGHGIDIAGGRVLMLAHARGLGHGFNPVSIYWCHSADGTPVAVVAEVHNTYGDRHAYLLRPAPDGSVDTTVDKQLYVSPFNPADGRYRITATPPGETITVTVSLERPGHAAFVATWQGRRQPEAGLVASALRSAGSSWRVSLLIRRQGLALWRRGLGIEPRPLHPPQEAVS